MTSFRSMTCKAGRVQAATIAALAALNAAPASAATGDWTAYGHDVGATRFSPLARIDRSNVAGMKPAWTFHTGDVADGAHGPRSGFETTPLMIDGTLYLTTPFNRVIALDPVKGVQLWAYDPKINKTWPYGDGLISRGLTAWDDTDAKAGAACRRRLFETTLDARLVALDQATGQPCAAFGQNGQVSLRDVPNYIPGQYHMTSPPVVVDGMVIVGSAIDDNSRAVMPSGVVRGFDARTGALRWSWEPLQDIARAPAGQPRRTGAGNAWAVMTADPDRHLVFVPTGSASPDYYGGLRPGDNRWANSVVALDTRTGKFVWGFQLVHHDLWDYDTAAAPVLTDLDIRGRKVAVVIAGNKTGMVYVLDRDTGRPVLPVEEKPVPQSDVPGEATSPTQPFPTSIPTLVPRSLTPDQAWGASDEDRKACRDMLGKMPGHGIFSPPSLTRTLAIPGTIGGFSWSGFAYDPGHRLLIAAMNNLPYWVRLIPRADFPTAAMQGRGTGEFTGQSGAPYAISRAPLKAPSGLPCAPPPWGMLTAVDLQKGVIKWQVPLGSMSELAPALKDTPFGSISLGGAMVTGGGLVFVAGTLDRRLHAFDVDTGKELWTGELPAAAHALPMTYDAGGRQYVVVAAGGSAKISEERQDDSLVAFALP